MLLLIKKIILNNTEDFLNDILTGKIDSKNDANNEYLKKIQGDVDLLKSKNYRRGGKTWKLIDIIDDAKYVVFVVSSPIDEKEDEKPEIINMPEEAEESAKQE